MIRRPNRSTLLIALLCACLVLLRAGGAHLHLCLDGSEPPVSLHVADSGEHHAEEFTGAPHADQDVSVGAEALVKKPLGDLDLTLLAAIGALLLYLLARPRETNPEFPTTPRLSPARLRLRPPLRGPPA